MSVVFFNNRYINEAEAHISINDIGLLRAVAVFEYLRTYNLKPFLLKEHLDRLLDSAKEIGLKIPISRKEIVYAIAKLISVNKPSTDTSIRIVLTGGPSPDGLHYNKNEQTFFIALGTLPQYPANFYRKGIKLITDRYIRPLPSVKSTFYLESLRLQPVLKKTKAQELLYIYNNLVTECSSSNIFALIDDHLVTPKEHILKGITRNLVIKICKLNNIKVKEAELSLEKLKGAQGCFITSTTREIMPVRQVDDKLINNGKIAPLIHRLQTLLQLRISSISK